MSPPESDTLSTVTLSSLQRVFSVNAYGPILLTQALVPNILAAKHARVAVMSSRMGSISDNSSGGAYAYRGSKAAVNALFKSLAMDLKEKGVAVILLHPGIVRTNMTTGLEAPGAVEPEPAAGELWRVLMGKGVESSGRWFHRSGEELPW
jgi:NAD(P)-dependent dehydrogenase (short-subunit alcohol dehydrogenase family)